MRNLSQELKIADELPEGRRGAAAEHIFRRPAAFDQALAHEDDAVAKTLRAKLISCVTTSIVMPFRHANA